MSDRYGDRGYGDHRGRGYGGRGYDGRDSRRDYGRDRRERSPDRRSGAHYSRDDRRQDITARYSPHDERGAGRGRGASPSSTSSQAYPSSATSMPSTEHLPSIPGSVEIPQGKGAPFPGQPLTEPRGQSGKRIVVKVNHFAIESLPVVKIFCYEVRMRVPESSQRRGSEKVSAMQQAKVLSQDQHLWGKFFVFDGVSFGWSTEELFTDAEQKSALVDLPGHTNDRPNQVEVTTRRAGKLNIRELVNYLQSGRAGLASGKDEVDHVFKALNALFRDDAAKRFITFPKSTAYFSRIDSLCKPLKSTGGVLEAMRGIFQSVAFGFGRLALNIDTKCAAFYTPAMCLINVAAAFCGVRNPADISQASCEEQMTGMYFSVKHLSEAKNSQKRRIQRLSDLNALTMEFAVKDAGANQEQKTNVNDYFMKKYNIRLAYPQLPLLVTRDGMFPMELCFTSPNERYKQPLQGAETADFIKFATSPAFVREKQIIDNVKRLAHWTLAKPKEWGISVSPHMMETSAVVLPAPSPVYHGNDTERNTSRGSWNLKGRRFTQGQAFRAWGLIYFPGGRQQYSEQELEGFCQELHRSLEGHGLHGPNRPPAILRGNMVGGNAEAMIRDLLNKTDNIFQAKASMILAIVHQSTPPAVYKACKQVCECLYGVPSQFMIAEKAMNSRGRLQYLSNIAMKVNAKLGGFNWTIHDPIFQSNQKVMILGADSTHPSPAELRRETPPPSYGCLVGSLDQYCAQYSAVTAAQASTQELIGTETMSAMFGELLKRFQNKNNATPDRIFFFRDGVSDHQVAAFLGTEVEALKKVRSELGLRFTLTVINCVKRHHTRVFPKTQGEGDKLGNVLPCTVVHNCKANNDIFSVSQAALQGTCRPTHYVSVYDENDLSMDIFQRLVLQGCFSYQRATRSVSLHSAVYYADQCCERAKLHLRVEGDRMVLKDVKPSLAYTMYWQ